MHFDLQDVSVQFDSIPALDHIHCSIESGAALMLTGSTGAGKTTLLKLLYADVHPSKGDVFLAGQLSSALNRRRLRQVRSKMGIIFQDIKLLSSLTVYENVIAPLMIAGFSKRASDKRCLEILSELGISYVRDKFPQQLSGGEKQLVALARAIMHRPDCIIADEPTGNVDGEIVQRIADALKRENMRGATLIIATHDPILLSQFLGTERITLHEGRMLNDAAMNSTQPQF